MADEKKESLKLQQQEFKNSLAKSKTDTLEKIKELKGTSPQVQEAAKRLADSFARLTNQVNNLTPKGGGGGGGGMFPDTERVPGKKQLKMKKGGMVKSSASKRADGIAMKGKTKGRMV
jgi:hypothetical protein